MQQTSISTQEVGYYQKKYVQYLLLEGCKNREMAFLGNNAPARALNIKCLYDFERAMNWVNWEKHRQNMYRTVSKIRSIPQFTFNAKLRSSETGKWFEEEFDGLVYEYDLFLDFDKDENSSIEQVLEEVKKIKSYFDDYKIPYYILYSGSKGFQVIIDGRYMPKFKIEEGVVQPHKKIAEKIKENFRLKYIDLRNNGIPNRLCKIPYSLVKRNVALPLSDKQIEKFNVKSMDLEMVMYEVVPMIRRGNLERFEELSGKQKIKNIQEFIKLNLK